MEWLRIRAPARLHLGFIPPTKGSEPAGSAAVAISEPELVMSIRESDEVHVTGAYADEFFSLVSRFIKEYAPGKGVEIRVENAIRRHMGLGSGTRMALSVGMGISRIYGIDADHHEIAEFFGRGRNSRAGLETLINGGFSISFPDGLSIPVHPPDDWSFVIAIPNLAHRFFGNRERMVMRELNRPPQTDDDIAEMLLNAIEKEDIQGTGELLNRLDSMTGKWFGEVQNGDYTDEFIEKTVSFGRRHGAYGAGQSSWGPAVYFLTEAEKANKLRHDIQRFLDRNCGGVSYVSEISKKGICLECDMEMVHVNQKTGEENRILYKS